MIKSSFCPTSVIWFVVLAFACLGLSCATMAAAGDMCLMAPENEEPQDTCTMGSPSHSSNEIFDVDDQLGIVERQPYTPSRQPSRYASPSALIYYDEEPGPSDYRLKIGDTMLISVYGEKGTEREVVVDPRGMLTYLFVDAIPASGKTIAEIRQVLEERLTQYYRFVALSLTPVKFNAEFFTVVGEVQDPGRKPIVGNPTVLGALCQAGGFTTLDYRDQLVDLCQLDKAFLARKGEYLPVDFVRLVTEGDLSQDLPMEAGDYLFLPNLKMKQVFVLGEVLQTVTIDYLHNISLIEAMAEAGDVSEYASSRVVVLRGSLACPVRYLIDYPRIVKGSVPDFPLQPGDIVYVPQRRLTRLREIVREAIRIFVNTAANVAGTEAFVRTHPHARGDFNFGNSFSGAGGVVSP